MKIVRFETEGIEKHGILEEEMVWEISGDIFGEFSPGETVHRLKDLQLLAPCIPSKVIAVGLNYKDHIKEFGDREIPKNPTIFVKLPHAVIGPEDFILLPKGHTRVDYEAELAVVIKKICWKVEAKEAGEYLLGATCLNDVTERHIQKEDGQWTRAKNFDTFCPIGPCIVDGLDYNALDVKSFLNGELRQESNTRHLIWNVYELVSFISQIMPLNPGDIVTTGTPHGVGPMKEGDIIEIFVEGVGTLRNPVKNAT